MPSPGLLACYEPPAGPGVRVDDGVSQGDEVPSHYDPMVAKIIVAGEDRNHAMERMRSALAELRVGGIRTNIDLLRTVLDTPDFVAGQYSTGLIDALDDLGAAPLTDVERKRLAAMAALLHHRASAGKTVARSNGSSNGSQWQADGWKRAMRGLSGGGSWG